MNEFKHGDACRWRLAEASADLGQQIKLAGMVETHNALYFWTDGSLRSVHTPRFCLSTYLRWLAKHYFSLPDGRGRTNSMMAQSPKPTSRATGGHSVTETSDEAEYKSFEP